MTATTETPTERAHRLIPGGGTCYSKLDDRFPPNAPRFIRSGHGAHVIDERGEWLDWGMGLRSVILGHGFDEVVREAFKVMVGGANHTRPTYLEGELAERLTDLIPCGHDGMASFGKNGSDAVTAAVRLARAATGRTRILACADPFHASDDWWLSTQVKRLGTVEQGTHLFDYNGYGVLKLIESREYAAVVMEPMSFEWPIEGFLETVAQTCRAFGTVLIFDEVITGFRFDLRGAQHVFGVTPDLACFGKAMANGFAVSALVGKRSIMELADGRHGVHAMSATHGGDTHDLAAALATIDVLEREDVSGYIGRIGKRLQDGLRAAGYDVIGHPTSPAIRWKSEEERMAFVAKLCDRGILAPYFAPSFSHTEADVDRTIEAAS